MAVNSETKKNSGADAGKSGAGKVTVNKGDNIKVEYTGTFEDGTVFDSSEGKEPLEFEAGSGRVIKGFDDAVIGMKNGEQKKITIPPAQAYGDLNPHLTKKIPRSSLPEGPEPKAGMMLAVSTPDGQQFPVRIAEVSAEEVTLDLNHPLAGKTLLFTVRIMEIL
ncbi:MAG TPA: peptidylprolyl isomerase [Candidatus Nanoarchaeia archaeon]|nr:peptidylprolyl isomerase [Candidatus Nanoarchaeia archaeon]